MGTGFILFNRRYTWNVEHFGATSTSGCTRDRRDVTSPVALGTELNLHYTARMKDLMDRIVIDPAVRSGKPCIRGTRITVYDILEYLAGGMSTEELLAEFPELKGDDVQAVLQFAAARERRLASSH